MTTNKKHKKTHNNQQSIEPYSTIRYLFIFVTTLGKICILSISFIFINVFTNYFGFYSASVTIYHIHKELMRPKLEHLVVYEVSFN